MTEGNTASPTFSPVGDFVSREVTAVTSLLAEEPADDSADDRADRPADDRADGRASTDLGDRRNVREERRGSRRKRACRGRHRTRVISEDGWRRHDVQELRGSSHRELLARLRI